VHENCHWILFLTVITRGQKYKKLAFKTIVCEYMPGHGIQANFRLSTGSQDQHTAQSDSQPDLLVHAIRPFAPEGIILGQIAPANQKSYRPIYSDRPLVISYCQ
jgi:hypothetical protein